MLFGMDRMLLDEHTDEEYTKEIMWKDCFYAVARELQEWYKQSGLPVEQADKLEKAVTDAFLSVRPVTR